MLVKVLWRNLNIVVAHLVKLKVVHGRLTALLNTNLLIWFIETRRLRNRQIILDNHIKLTA